MKNCLFALSTLVLPSIGLVFSEPAKADVIVCNHSGHKYLSAISWNSPSGITTAGWAQIAPGQCVNANFRGDTRDISFAVYGQNTGGSFHTGSANRCVIKFPVQAKWTLDNADDSSVCTGNGRVMVPFREARTNSTDVNYTYILRD